MEVMCNHRNIRLHFTPDRNMPVLQLDTVLFDQVLLNIIKNIDSNTHSLTIADTGKGISKKTERKLFSPFFSAKPSGQGIGLLFIREVPIQHNCLYSLRTYPDGLTRFFIEFSIR